MKPKWNHGLIAMLVVSTVFAFHFYSEAEQYKITVYQILWSLDKPEISNLKRTFYYDKDSIAYKSVNWEFNYRNQ